jgi:signal transduction histidine kinase
MVFSLLASGCGMAAGVPDAEDLPYELTEHMILPHPTIAADLDGDGEDELVNSYSPTQSMPDRFMAVVLRRHTGEGIEQVNFAGIVRPPLIADLERDGLPEILVPVIRSDSLFVSVVSGTGSKLRSFLVTTGTPRMEPEGPIAWDPQIIAAFVTDVEGDGADDLVLVVVTGYARLPRGVFVHALPDGRPKGAAIVGAGLMQAILDDFDGDGLPEIVTPSIASNNGADAGGFDDSEAHLLLFELSPTPHVARSLVLPVAAGLGQVVYEDVDGDGRRELLATVGSVAALGGRGSLRLLDPLDWRTLRERTIAEPLSSPIAIDLDRDARTEILALHGGRDLWVLNDRFELLRSRRLPAAPVRIEKSPDITGDGIAEPIVQLQGGPTLLLGPDLEPVAELPGFVRGVVRRGIGTPPLVLFGTGETNVVGSLERNPFYLVHRYGPIAAGAVGLALLLATVVTLVRLRNENHRMRAAQAAIGMSGPPALLVDGDGRVRWASATLLDGHAPRRGRWRAPALAAIERSAPGISAVVRNIAVHRSERRGGGPESAPGFRIEPVLAGARGDPHWIVRVEAPTPADGTRAWTLMAQRVAHGLKNPLTSMLLTLRRLEMEYRERAPGVASRLDRYSSRLEERIEELRRLTSNFLKFVDVEAPELTLTDPNELVRGHGAALERTLPPDIRLELRCRPGMPTVRLDRDQMQAALDNLIANAINAMPDGGLITLATDHACGIQWPADAIPHDYVAIEVADTGTGIPDDFKAQVFEPGRSSREDGSGLGLAIVRKIVGDHGGRVTFESEVGSGSAFTMYLPADATTEEPRRMTAELPAAGP